LLRLVRSAEAVGSVAVGSIAVGSIAVDLQQIEPGRGAYLHRTHACLDLAVRRRAVGRALRTTSLDSGQVLQAVQPHLPSDGGTA